MTEQHTPGPWHWDPIERTITSDRLAGGHRITWFYDHVLDANGRLFAAAPDLLASCQALVVATSDSERLAVRNTAFAAIAKANGSTTP